jgi:hypothetical protein
MDASSSVETDPIVVQFNLDKNQRKSARLAQSVVDTLAHCCAFVAIVSKHPLLRLTITSKPFIIPANQAQSFRNLSKIAKKPRPNRFHHSPAS